MATISVLMENEEFVKGLVEATTPAELGELFTKNNIELEEGISLEEAFEIVKSQENAELSENDLEDVSGGIALSLAVSSVACFVLAGAELSFIGGYAYQKYRQWRKR